MDVSQLSTDDKLLGGLAMYLLKECFRIYKDGARKNTKDIGKLQIQAAKLQSDLNSAWMRIRNLEKRD
jgi:hypothetical protein